MTRISSNIRAGHGRLWGGLKRAARAGLSIHIPVTRWNKPLFAFLYSAHIAARESLAWLLRCLWFEPLFRSQCESVGPRFQMERLPYIIGRGRITIGSEVRLSGKSGFGFSSRADTPPRLEIGDGTFIGHDCGFSIAHSVTIGSGCLLAGRVTVRDSDGHPTDFEQRRQKQPSLPEAIRPVVIGDDVWIGAGAVILKGVTIGDRAIVGAGAIVTSDVPEDTVVAGNPARVIKQLPKSSALANEGRAAA